MITVSGIREHFAKISGADFTEPITAGIFVSIAAWASTQRKEDKTPYWRTLKAKGELNAKYPGGVEAQKEMLEKKGIQLFKKAGKISDISLRIMKINCTKYRLFGAVYFFRSKNPFFFLRTGKDCDRFTMKAKASIVKMAMRLAIRQAERDGSLR